MAEKYCLQIFTVLIHIAYACICLIQTIRQSHPSADGSVKLYRWTHESPLARKRESCDTTTRNIEKFEPILRSSPTLWLNYWSPKSLNIHVTFQLWTSQVKNLPAAGSCSWHGNAGISCSRTQGYRLAQCGKTSGIWGRQLHPFDLCKMCPCNAW